MEAHHHNLLITPLLLGWVHGFPQVSFLLIIAIIVVVLQDFSRPLCVNVYDKFPEK
jgi:dolichol kinase